MPVILPLLEEPRTLLRLAESLDGILLTGSSSDVDPAHYGAERERDCGPVQPLRDKTDFFLSGVAVSRNIPILGICFGMQSLNVFMGGTLVQDIPSRLSSQVQHSCPQSNGKPTHPVCIASGSVLEELAGGLESQVNSTHHQAVEKPGRDLEVIAWSPDGIPEAVMSRSGTPWMLGVQWHPEKSFDFDEFSNKIFHHFLARCRAK